jgi:PhnB protein
MTNQIERNESKTFSIEPWLTVNNGDKAVEFYKSAFNAIETYRLQGPNGSLVVRLSLNGADFWISSETSSDHKSLDPLGGNSIRMILIVDDPDTLYAQAMQAGATEIFAVGEDHGWRLGRLADPFGLHWEVGYQLSL